MSGPLEYGPAEAFPGVAGRTVSESTPAWPRLPTAPAGAPNVIVVLLDDVGFAQPSPFGGWCEMPTFERIAARGLRFTNFHTTPLCSPTRASILSGRNHHTVGVGSLVEMSMGFPGYHAMAGPEYAFLPAILRDAGWNSFAVGKWHLTPPGETSAAGPYRTWPLGRGFERWYGFMTGDTSQWFPDLLRDNTAIPTPATPEDGYHLNADLADQAIQMIKDAHVAAPEKPFFLYYATGAGHAPHHVEPEWIERYSGRFDLGWDAYREEVFAKQVADGLVPAHTVLSERDPDVPAWDSLTADAKRMFARQMETYAGFLSQTDHHLGRVIDYVEQLGELDNTIVLLLSDNGASSEGGPEGTMNEAMFFNFVPERLEDNLPYYDDWGGFDAYPHYAWGWTWAGNTPFRRWKRETYRGGVAEPCILSWPAGFDGDGGVRHQYAHAVDVLTTILDAAGVALPESVGGVAQEPFHGVSLVPACRDAVAPDLHTRQYFEMNGYRAIYDEGWRAVCPFGGPSLAEAQAKGRSFMLTEVTPEVLAELDSEWELYDTTADPAETRNLAAEQPERVQKMVDLWYAEAEKYGVLPVATNRGNRILGPRPSAAAPRKTFVFHPDAAPLAFTAAPRLAGRAHTITADVTVPDGGATGVLLQQGGRHVGFALYLDPAGRLVHTHNYVGLERFTVSSPDPVPAGRRSLRYEFAPTGPPTSFLVGQGVPALSKLYVDGTLVAVTELPYSLLASFGFFGVTCGYATPDAVDPAVYRPPYRSTAVIDQVVLDVTGEVTDDGELLLREVMGRQ